MKRFTLIALATLFASTSAFAAAGPTCEAQAMDKKLAGAAKTSFMKKCDKDTMQMAAKVCGDQAMEKKLAGAAKNSFMKKCEKDAVMAK
ncbi:MAG: hypothetical protein ABIR52_10045 [Casimicrobiaceae bacterium]